MANVDRVRGLHPVKKLDGSQSGVVNTYFVPATDTTALFIGDAVKTAASASADGYPTITQAAAGDSIRGVVVGIVPETSESLMYRAASTARHVLVNDDPDTIFEIQEDSVGGSLAATSPGQNADLIVGAGDTATATSGMELDSSTAAGATSQLRILGLARRADNEIGTNAKWLVKINEHELTQTAGA